MSRTEGGTEDSLQDISDQLRWVLTEVYGALREGDGYTDASIARAEAKLGLSMPAVLRKCWRIAGQHRGLRRGLQNLLPMGKMETRTLAGEGEFLVFLTERQGATFSVIRHTDLEAEDPPVYQSSDEDAVLYPSAPRLSSLLLKTACWNAMQLLPAGGHAKAGADDLARAYALLTRVGGEDAGGGWVNNRLSAFFRPGLAACVFPDAKSDGTRFDLYVAARSGDEYRRFQQECGIRLSHF